MRLLIFILLVTNCSLPQEKKELESSSANRLNCPMVFETSSGLDKFGGKMESFKFSNGTIVNFQFENLDVLEKNIAFFSINNVVAGYIDYNDNYKVPQHDKLKIVQLGTYSEGYYHVTSENKKIGFLDENMNYAINPEYDSATNFIQGLSFVKKNGSGFFINKRNEKAFNTTFEDSYNFHNGIAPVKIKGKWGYIDLNGKLLIKPKYENARYFWKDFAAVQSKGKYGFINEKGEIIIDFKYEDAGGFSNNGLVRVRKEGKWGFIDKEDNEIIPFIYDDTEYFPDDNVALVVLNGNYLFIDKQGNKIFNKEFNKAYSFSNGLAPVFNGSKWGYIDLKGILVIDYIFDDASEYLGNLAKVKYNGLWGLLKPVKCE